MNEDLNRLSPQQGDGLRRATNMNAFQGPEAGSIFHTVKAFRAHLCCASQKKRAKIEAMASTGMLFARAGR